MQHKINPKVDCAFKALLGAEENRALLIDFLNAMLIDTLPRPISAVRILDPYNPRETLEDKLTIVDVKARDAAGRVFQIEIQLVVYADLTTRMLYARADLYRRQLRRGQDYSILKPTYAIWRVVNTYKMAKHLILDIAAEHFDFHIDEAKVTAEAALDGLYVIRTSLPAAQSSDDETVRRYKSLSHVEAAFRSLKSDDLQIRPIYHYSADRVRAHLFLCMLAYYVKWHMSEAWRGLLFADEDQERLTRRDPVAPATRSEAALRKAATKQLPDGSPAHSFRTLLNDLATIVRNTCRRPNAPSDEATFDIDTTPTPKQSAALDLIKAIRV